MSTRRSKCIRFVSIENQPACTTSNFGKQTQEGNYYLKAFHSKWIFIILATNGSDLNGSTDLHEYKKANVTHSSHDIHFKSKEHF